MQGHASDIWQCGIMGAHPNAVILAQIEDDKNYTNARCTPPRYFRELFPNHANYAIPLKAVMDYVVHLDGLNPNEPNGTRATFQHFWACGLVNFLNENPTPVTSPPPAQEDLPNVMIVL